MVNRFSTQQRVIEQKQQSTIGQLVRKHQQRKTTAAKSSTRGRSTHEHIPYHSALECRDHFAIDIDTKTVLILPVIARKRKKHTSWLHKLNRACNYGTSSLQCKSLRRGPCVCSLWIGVCESMCVRVCTHVCVLAAYRLLVTRRSR